MPVYKAVNKKFFKKWAPEMAYVLGFFAADGYITINRRGGQFWCIQIIDRKLLQEIKKTINAKHKIGLRKGKGNEQNLYRLQIGSIEMCDDLRRLGYNERKTKNLAVPSIPQKYFHHFVRGYFDGDGHVWVGEINKKRKKRHVIIQTVFTSCSEKFLESLRVRLETNNIFKGTLRKGKGDFYRLVYSINNSLKLYDFMYNRIGKSKLFLERKRVMFTRYLGMRA